MTVIVVFGGIMIVAFLASFFSGRRFGVMALSLAVGSLLASWWGRLVADQLHSLGITIAGLPQTIFATLILLLLPLVAALISGPKYHKKREKIISSAGIAVLIVALLTVPLGGFIKMDALSLTIYKTLAEIWRYLATAGFVAGIIDLLLLHNGVARHLPKKH